MMNKEESNYANKAGADNECKRSSPELGVLKI